MADPVEPSSGASDPRPRSSGTPPPADSPSSARHRQARAIRHRVRRTFTWVWSSSATFLVGTSATVWAAGRGLQRLTLPGDRPDVVSDPGVIAAASEYITIKGDGARIVRVLDNLRPDCSPW
jgi:hypothetical protein